MDRDRLITVLASVFAGLSVSLVMVGIVLEPFVLFVAVPFAAVSYFMWYQASGRLTRRIYASVEDRARVEDRDREWDANRTRARRRGREARTRHADGGRRARSRSGAAPGRPGPDQSPTRREAYRRLDLDPGAGEEAVREAYRERVKEVHPDGGGSEEAFRRVQDAYERLTEE